MLINRPVFFTKRVEILFCRVFTWMKDSMYGEKKIAQKLTLCVNTVLAGAEEPGERILSPLGIFWCVMPLVNTKEGS